MTPSRTREYLLPYIAGVIHRDNPSIAEQAISETSRILHSQLAIVEIGLRRQGLLADGEQLCPTDSVGAIIEQLVAV